MNALVLSDRDDVVLQLVQCPGPFIQNVDETFHEADIVALKMFSFIFKNLIMVF